MKKLQYSFEEINTKIITYFLITFFLIYGINLFTTGFAIQYSSPLDNNLNPNFQWVLESPIQFFIGYLFSFLPYPASFIVVQIIAILYLIGSCIFLCKHQEIDKSSLFFVLALSPFFLIIFTWFGKPDLFLIGSYFSIVAFQRVRPMTSLLFFIIGVFSHPQIFIFLIIFSYFLNLIQLNTRLIFYLFFCYLIYFFYLANLGEIYGRDNFIFDNLIRLITAQVRNPFFSLFCTFGWLWFVILFNKKEIPKIFFFIVVLIFLITILTLDHTRIFTLLSLPCIIFLAKNYDIRKFIKNINRYIPIWFFLFFQFQKNDGFIVDTTWSYKWAPLLKDFISSLL
tara:strand:- start:685 stop:1701 length:1017 start_codon:yes stop_codon:yes gene_type:complete